MNLEWIAIQSLYSNCPPAALTNRQTVLRHTMTALSITLNHTGVKDADGQFEWKLQIVIHSRFIPQAKYEVV